MGPGASIIGTSRSTPTRPTPTPAAVRRRPRRASRTCPPPGTAPGPARDPGQQRGARSGLDAAHPLDHAARARRSSAPPRTGPSRSARRARAGLRDARLRRGQLRLRRPDRRHRRQAHPVNPSVAGKDAAWQSPPSTTSPLPAGREWDGAAAEKRVRAWADAEDKPDGKYRDAHVWDDAGSKQNFTAYKLLFTDVIDGPWSPCHGRSRRQAILCRAHAAASTCRNPTSPGSRTHLAKYYKKMGETAPGNGTDGAFGSGPARPHPQAAARPR